MHLGFVIWVFQPFETFPNFQPTQAPTFFTTYQPQHTQPELPFLVDPPYHQNLPLMSTSSNFTFSKVTSIEADLSNCEPGSADPSTMETRLLRLVRTLSEASRAMEPCQAVWSVGWWRCFFGGGKRSLESDAGGRDGSNPMGLVFDGKWWGYEVIQFFQSSVWVLWLCHNTFHLYSDFESGHLELLGGSFLKVWKVCGPVRIFSILSSLSK